MGVIERLTNRDLPWNIWKILDIVVLLLILFAGLKYKQEIESCQFQCNKFIVENCDNYEDFGLRYDGEVIKEAKLKLYEPEANISFNLST